MNKIFQNIHKIQVLRWEGYTLKNHIDYSSIEEPCAFEFDSFKVKPPGGLCM
jgi:hypothetical protein